MRTELYERVDLFKDIIADVDDKVLINYRDELNEKISELMKVAIAAKDEALREMES